jgi:hypothetical protein
LDRKRGRISIQDGPVFSCSAAGPGRDEKATILTLVNMIGQVHDVLVGHGYKLIDDAWITKGRRTYIQDENLSASQLKNIQKVLGNAGWRKDLDAMWILRHPSTGEMLEFEPGGDGATGNFVHHMKAIE